MPISQLIVQSTRESRHAIDSLIARGWLVTTAPVHWSEQHACIICGEGLNLARHLAERPSHADYSAPSKPDEHSETTSPAGK